MAIKIRPGDLVHDRDAVVSLLARHVNPDYDARRYDWLYLGNPAGPARLWMAVDGATGDPVGTASAFPRRLGVDGGEVGAWLLGDFCIAEKHRALGPALQLQRACLDELAGEGVPICFDFPSHTMEAVYRRLGIDVGRRLVRMARPLRARDKLRQRWGDSLAVRVAGALGDRVLARGLENPRAPRGLSLGLHEGPCGDDFTALAALAGPTWGVCVRRTAGYLDWRYRDNPIRPHEILVARRAGALVAYAVVARKGEIGAIVDLFGVPDATVMRALIRHAAAHLWRQGAASVSITLPASHVVAWLTAAGFRPRESAALAVYAPAGSGLGARLAARSDWFLTDGDRDG